MTHYSGIVSRIGSKVFGDKTSYYFFLDGVEGLFKMGGKRPTFKEGSQVEFDTDAKSYVEWNSIKSAVAAPEPAKTAQAAATAAPARSAAPLPVAPFDRYRNKQFAYEERRNINRQVARKLAFEEVTKLLELGVFVLPKTQNKMYEAYMAYVAKQTEAIYTDIVADHDPAVAPKPVLAIVPAQTAADAEVSD